MFSQKPPKIDVKLLERFPEFNEFKQLARASQTGDLFPSAAETTPTSSA